MTTTATIDERIRAAAYQALKSRIQRAAQVFSNEVRAGSTGAYLVDGLCERVPLRAGEARLQSKPAVPIYKCIDLIEKAAIANLRAHFEQEAVDAFLQKVESLDDQIAELRDSIG